MCVLDNMFVLVIDIEVVCTRPGTGEHTLSTLFYRLEAANLGDLMRL